MFYCLLSIDKLHCFIQKYRVQPSVVVHKCQWKYRSAKCVYLCRGFIKTSFRFNWLLLHKRQISLHSKCGHFKAAGWSSYPNPSVEMLLRPNSNDLTKMWFSPDPLSRTWSDSNPPHTFHMNSVLDQADRPFDGIKSRFKSATLVFVLIIRDPSALKSTCLLNQHGHSRVHIAIAVTAPDFALFSTNVWATTSMHDIQVCD